MRKTIAVFLVFSLLCLSGSLFAEKKGADIVINKKDGQQEKGELIAVKRDSLLLMEKGTGADVSVRFGDTEKVIIVKKSKVWKGIGLGILSGAGLGAIAGLSVGDEGWFSAEVSALLLGSFFGVVFGLIGGIAGAIQGVDETIQFEGLSDHTIRSILIELSKKARVPDFQ